MDWNVVITGAVFSAVSALFIWFTQRYLPARDKRIEDALLRRFTQQEGVRDFNEASQGTSLQQILTTQEQLIKHIIESNNGHLSKLTSEVIRGDKELSGKLEKIVAGFNLLIVLMSRNRAMPTVAGVKDWGNVGEVMEAIINSEEEQDVSDLSDAAAGKEKASNDR